MLPSIASLAGFQARSICSLLPSIAARRALTAWPQVSRHLSLQPPTSAAAPKRAAKGGSARVVSKSSAAAKSAAKRASRASRALLPLPEEAHDAEEQDEHSATSGIAYSDEDDAKVIKWSTFVHNGPCFPEAYTPLPANVKFIYDGRALSLPENVEEAVVLFAARLESPLLKNSNFVKNFMADLNALVKATRGNASIPHPLEFAKCDFSLIAAHLMKGRERSSKMSAKEKKRLADVKMQLKEKHGFATIDDVRVPVQSYMIEPPSIFLGRGNNKHTGKIKSRLFPSDITLNLSTDAPIPPSPFPHHPWKAVVNRPTALWLASWKCPITGLTKSILPASTSPVRQEMNLRKFEKARKLGSHIARIRSLYTAILSSAQSSLLEKQVAVCIYLFDTLALRPGGSDDDAQIEAEVESGESEGSETEVSYGVFTLLRKHVELKAPSNLALNFPGKDLVVYNNTVSVPAAVFSALEKIAANKKPGERLFDKSTSRRTLALLKSVDPDFSFKTFRTFSASSLFERLLPDVKHVKDAEVKKSHYDLANTQVAKLCNHQKVSSPASLGKIDAKRAAVTKHKKAMAQLQAEVKEQERLLGSLPSRSKESAKASAKLKTLKEKLQKAKDKMPRLEASLRLAQETKSLALNTSKLNYIDPRISVAWCKRNALPVSKVFSKSVQEKMSWALDADEDFIFSSNKA